MGPPRSVLLLAAEPDSGALHGVIGAITLVVLIGFILLMIVLLTSFVVSRAARRRRAAADRRRRDPTPADDVWAMHKLPEDSDWP